MRKRLVLLFGALAVLCSACVKADISLDVNDDGSGTFTGITAFNGKVFEQFGGLAALGGDTSDLPDSGDFCKDVLTEAQADETLDGAKVEPYRNGDFCGVKVTAPFKNIDEALSLLDGMGGSGGTGLEDVTLEKTGNGYAFSASWSGTDSSGLGSSSDDPFTKQLLAGFSFVVRIKLPGGQVSQNADLIDDNGAMVWNLDPAKSRELKAQTDSSKPVIKGQVVTDAGKSIPGVTGSSSAGSKSSSKTWIFVGIGLLVVAAIVAFVLVKRSKSKGAPVALATAGPAPAMPAPAAAQWTPAAPAAPAAPVAPAAPAAPAAQWSPAAPAAPAAPVAPAAPAAPTAPAAPAATPAPEAAGAAQPSAADAPQWDAARNAYIQYDRVNQRWMQYDQAAATWRPIE